ncbi:unnamed protein product [Thelazia callipaeda]|uniref:Uncharacterized protein n=1 Tax=Thelazia callipaeda TaxID=103827 RepID=A0A0N5CPM6_THECL|nr:unnamed protein product [Thelazia callipaeda]
MSVKRKSTRIAKGMKLIDIKSVDELFKQATTPLTASTEMREKLEFALVKWRNDCGLGPAGTIRQGLRLMLTRTKTAATNASLPETLQESDDSSEVSDNTPSFAICSDEKTYPIIVTRGVFPEKLQRTFDSMSALLDICAKIQINTNPLLMKLEKTIKQISECYEELTQLCANAGLRGAKANRAMENFAWNVRLLKAELTLMNKTQSEANDILTQV